MNLRIFAMEENREALLEYLGDKCECPICDFAPDGPKACPNTKLVEKLKDPKQSVADAVEEFADEIMFLQSKPEGGIQ